MLRTPTQYIVLRPDGKYYIYNPNDVKPIRLLSDTIKTVNKSKNLTKVLKKLNEKGKKRNWFQGGSLCIAGLLGV